MSLIGPRPYLPREKKDMGQYYNSIIKCKPGVTGMWQANGRSDVEFNYRCKLDDYYYHNCSPEYLISNCATGRWTLFLCSSMRKE